MQELKIGTDVEVIGGQYAGERGRVMERYTGYGINTRMYGVRLLTGPLKDEPGTFVAQAHEVREAKLEAGT